MDVYEVYSLCRSCHNRYVVIQTRDGRCHRCRIIKVDPQYVYIVPRVVGVTTYQMYPGYAVTPYGIPLVSVSSVMIDRY